MKNASGFPTLEGETDPFADADALSLPASVRPLAAAYDERIADRDRSLWRWLYRATAEFGLSCVEPDRVEHARSAKVLATMFITVVDDVAERYGDRETLAELLKVPFEHQDADPTRAGAAGEYVRFQRELWTALRALYDDGPRAGEFANLFRFDLRQALQSVDYSALLAQYPPLASERELWTYDAHNMMVLCFAGIDLAYSPSFDTAELAPVRQVVTRAQRMARVGNWIATWERELAEGDCSSGVVVRALETGVVSSAELQALRRRPTDDVVEPVVAAIRESDIEAYFVDRWRSEYDEAAQFVGAVESVDLRAYLEGFETIFRAQLANRPSN
ncbi:terpene synthase family protein [Natronorubrum sp. FCH18a]|uniref:terpene synthase family protein n=1 Tax=Natronorubrum sp. FCH18a TaxID=3447018 RepID=UPI003F50EAE8